MMRRFTGLAILAMALGSVAQAHEFWIDPIRPQVDAGAPLVAHLRVGDKLKGATYSYIPRNFRRFELVQGDAVIPVEGRLGDVPGLNMPAPHEGLVTVVHLTKDYTITYNDWQKFTNFCEHKDFTDVLDAHRARGLPETGFVERYSRHAKSLMAVGDGAGADTEVGLEVEIIALGNPYTDDLSNGLPIEVRYQGAPRADVQVEIFARDLSNSITITTTRTDADGRAVIDVAPGHFYLLDHVVMRPLDPLAEKDPVWESLWASLSFVTPS